MPDFETILRQFARETRALRKQIAAAARGDAKAIHRARIATRRLREALPIVAADLGAGARRLRKRVRRVTRSLGPVRELDVSLALLESRTGYGALALGSVRQHLASERGARRKQLRTQLQARKVAKLQRRLRALARRKGEPDQHEWTSVLAVRIARRIARLRRATEEARWLYAPDALHAVRISVKQLRYCLELAAVGTRRQEAAAAVRGLKRAQQVLGRMHDIDVLLMHLRAVQIEARLGWSDDLERLARDLEADGRQLHSRYVRQAPQLREICDRAADIAATLAGESRPRRTRALKMGLGDGRRRRPVAASR